MLFLFLLISLESNVTHVGYFGISWPYPFGTRTHTLLTNARVFAVLECYALAVDIVALMERKPNANFPPVISILYEKRPKAPQTQCRSLPPSTSAFVFAGLTRTWNQKLVAKRLAPEPLAWPVLVDSTKLPRPCPRTCHRLTLLMLPLR